MKRVDNTSTDRFLKLQEKLLRPKCGMRALRFTAGCMAFAWLNLLAYYPDTWRHGSNLAILALGSALFAIPTFAAFYFALRHEERKPVLHILGGMDDPRIVELFLRLSQSNRGYWLPRVTPTLIRLLPHLKRSDAPLFRSSAQAELHWLLSLPDPDLVLAILQALPVIGTIRALPHVGPHAEGLTLASQDYWVQEAATECRTILRKRADRVKGPDMTLLRASSAPIAEQTLLRPMLSGDSEIASDQLLRAHQSSPPS